VSRPKTLIEFSRVGGRPPADDEAVTIADDGSFQAHRTLGGRRIGRFAGMLPAASLKALRRAVEAVRDAEDVAIPTPADGATETVTLGRRDRARFGSNERPPKPWSALVTRLRDILRDVVVEHPVAALELQDIEGGVRLARLGEGTLEVDLAGASYRATRLDRQGIPVGRSNGGLDPVAAGEARGAWTAAGPGWTLDVPLGAAAEAAPDTSLQVLLFLTLREGDVPRDGRLVAVQEGSGRLSPGA
jgi:hypothetical protein